MEFTGGQIIGIVGGTTMVSLAAFRAIEMLIQKIRPNGVSSISLLNKLVDGCDTMGDAVKLGAQQIHDLHSWHNQRDSEGKPLWFFPNHAMKELIDSNKELTKTIRDLVMEIRRTK